MPTIGNRAYILRWKLAVAALRTGHDRLRLAHAVRRLGGAYYCAGHATLAERCYIEALSIYRNSRQGDLPESREWFLTAAAAADSAADPDTSRYVQDVEAELLR